MSDNNNKVGEVFNILGMSSTTSAIDDLHQEVELITRDNELAAIQLTENCSFIEKADDMLLDEKSIDDSKQN